MQCFVIILLALLSCSSTVFGNYRLTNDAENSTQPCVARGSDGLARVAWCTLQGGVYQIMWGAYDNEGRCVIGPVQVTTGGTSSRLPNISIDARNRSFLIWQLGASTSARVYFARVDADGALAVPPVMVNVGSGYDWDPVIATTPDGLSHDAFQHTSVTLWHQANMAGNLWANIDSRGQQAQKRRQTGPNGPASSVPSPPSRRPADARCRRRWGVRGRRCLGRPTAPRDDQPALNHQPASVSVGHEGRKLATARDRSPVPRT